MPLDAPAERADHKLSNWHKKSKCIKLNSAWLVMCDLEFNRPAFTSPGFEPLSCCEENVLIFSSEEALTNRAMSFQLWCRKGDVEMGTVMG